MNKTSNKIIYFVFLALLIPILTGCAAPQTMRPQVNNQAVAREAIEQQKLIYKRAQSDRARVARVAFPILTRNTQFCSANIIPMDGLTAWTIDLFQPAEQIAIRQIYGLGKNVTLSNVIPKSPGAKAGLKTGDILISINGFKLQSGKIGLKTAGQILKTAGFKQSQIIFLRKGKVLNAILRPIKGCDYPVRVDQKSSVINAFADGHNIIISKGILRLTENDTELALVIAHEMAHNTMSHIKKKKTNALAGVLGGTAIDILLQTLGAPSGGQFSKMGAQIGAGAHSVSFEQEADYVGMYYMERAGYNAKNVAYFWRRMAIENGGKSLYVRKSHPTSPERFVAIGRTYDEIQKKKRKRIPLLPNIKKK